MSERRPIKSLASRQSPSRAQSEEQREPSATILRSSFPTVANNMRLFLERELPRGLLDLYKQLRTSDRGLSSRPKDAQPARSLNLLAHLSQHTEIALINREGDARVTFRFEVVNLGLSECTSRVHQFWFEHPQSEIAFTIMAEGFPLASTITKSSPNFREVSFELPVALQPMETLQYEVSFRVEKEFSKHQYYSLCPRTVTDRLSFTVLAAPNFRLADAYVAHETSDGYLRDDSPSISVGNDRGRSAFSWELSDILSGDLFRTFWTHIPKMEIQPTSDVRPLRTAE